MSDQLRIGADSRPRLLELCSGAGGSAAGYRRAGFHVTGVDIEPQPRFAGDVFVQGDALEYLAAHGHEYDVIAGGPPCQRYTLAQRIQGNEHPDLIPPMREGMRATGRPYVIENVPGAPLIDPVELCGCMFPGLNVYRERLFELGGGVTMTAPPHRPHVEPLVKMGRPPRPGYRMHVVGNFSGADQGRAAMGIPWMTRNELREAIPPAYTALIGAALMRHVRSEHGQAVK